MEPVASSRCPSQRDQARASARAFLFRVPANNLRSQVVSSSAGRRQRAGITIRAQAAAAGNSV